MAVKESNNGSRFALKNLRKIHDGSFDVPFAEKMSFIFKISSFKYNCFIINFTYLVYNFTIFGVCIHP